MFPFERTIRLTLEAAETLYLPGEERRIAGMAIRSVRRGPGIIIASWCGKKFRAEKAAARPGVAAIPAVRTNRLHEVKPPLILQPGPAALTTVSRPSNRSLPGPGRVEPDTGNRWRLIG